jgi:hypothetical protein
MKLSEFFVQSEYIIFKTGSVAQVVEYLLYTCEALSSNSNPTKKKIHIYIYIYIYIYITVIIKKTMKVSLKRNNLFSSPAPSFPKS